jgi:hypothetical protein
MEIVKDMSTLKGMLKQNLIKFHEQTGTKIKGLYGGKSFTCYYIDDRADGVPSIFTYKNRQYIVKYFSGCFCPYVCHYQPN